MPVPCSVMTTDHEGEHTDEQDHQEKATQIAPGPDNDYKNFKQTRFHKSQTLDFKNGLRIEKKPVKGIGGLITVQDLILKKPLHEGQDQFRPSKLALHGQSRPKSAPAFRPRYCFLDKKILRFFAHFIENITNGEGFVERIRRNVQVLYFLEDDTMSIVEPKIKNSGLYQGLLLRRHRVPLHEPLLGDRAFHHWTDLAVGKTLVIYGRHYHLDSCDGFTKSFLISEGLDKAVKDQEDDFIDEDSKNVDEFVQTRERQHQVHQDQIQERRRESKTKKFLENDRKVLRSSEKSSKYADQCGDKSPKRAVSAGAKYLRRQKLSKHLVTNIAEEFPSARKFSHDDFITANDFEIGQDIQILSKRFHIVDCDDFTARYLQKHLGKDISSRRRDKDQKLNHRPNVLTPIPPHTKECIGDPEDSIQNCLRITPKPPKKDLGKFICYSGMTLRYEADMLSPWHSGSGRKFIFTYFLADDTFSIHEASRTNRASSKFLSRRKVAKPEPKVNGEPDFYTVEDFYIGSILHIYGQKFEIVGADDRVLKYINERQVPLPLKCEQSLREYFKRKGKEEAKNDEN